MQSALSFMFTCQRLQNNDIYITVVLKMKTKK